MPLDKAEHCKVAIVAANPTVALLIYREIYAQLAKTSMTLFEQPDSVVYVRQGLSRVSVRNQLNEGAEIAKRAGANLVFFPEIDAKTIVDVRSMNSTPIVAYHGVGSLIEADVRGLEDALIHETNLGFLMGDDVGRYATVCDKVELYAKHIISHALRSPDANGLVIEREKRSFRHVKSGSTLPDVGAYCINGFVGIHDGMGPEAGFKTAANLSQKGCDFLMMSEVSTPVIAHIDGLIRYMPETGRMVESHLFHNQHDGMVGDAMPRLLQARYALQSCGVDAVVMPCNTAHLYQAHLDSVTTVPVISLIEASIDAIPHGERALLLATDETLASNIYQDAVHRTNRHDITLVLPNEEEQQRIQSGIFDSVHGGRHEEGGRLFQSVIHDRQHQIDCVVAGCTEVVLGLSRVDGCAVPVIDNSAVAEDMTAKVAQSERQRKISEQNIARASSR